MELFVSEVGKIYPRRGFAQHMACIQMGGDGEVRDESVVLAGLPHRANIYLRDFGGFAAFFPSNETFPSSLFLLPFAFCRIAAVGAEIGGDDGLGDGLLGGNGGVLVLLEDPRGGLLLPVALGFF